MGGKNIAPAQVGRNTRHLGLQTNAKIPFPDLVRWFGTDDKYFGKHTDRPGREVSEDDPLWMPPPRPGNKVEFLISGEDTFNSIADALETTYMANGHLASAPRGAFIYLAGWWVEYDFNLRRHDGKSEEGTKLKDFLRKADQAGAMTRALFWDRVAFTHMDHNKVERDFIKNELQHGHAIADGRAINSTLEKGSHHQKFLLVNGWKGLIGFAGGVDFNYNRVFRYGEPFSVTEGTESDVEEGLKKWKGRDFGSVGDRGPLNRDMRGPPFPDVKELMTEDSAPYLDVHTRIEGPAAFDLLDVFLNRYADHPSAMGREVFVPHHDYDTRPGNVTVRVCTTFGDEPYSDPSDVGVFTPSKISRGKLKGSAALAGSVVTIEGDLLKGFSDIKDVVIKRYSFAPNGRQSGRAQLLYAISCARKYIYFEDQYMVSEEIARALAKALHDHQDLRVIGVIPHQSISVDFDPGGKGLLASVRLERFIRPIVGKGTNDRFRLFCPVRDRDYPDESIFQYIHSKVFIFDDEFCTIGSMNANLRSTTHDSELSLGFYEPPSSGAGTSSAPTAGFARRFRRRLWSRHLNLPEGHRKFNSEPIEAIDKLWNKIPAHDYDQKLGHKSGHLGLKLPDGTDVSPNVAPYDWSRDKTLGEQDWSTMEVAIPIYGLASHLRGPGFVDRIAEPSVKPVKVTPRDPQDK